MIIAVTDANIFIDLMNIDWLHYFFRLDLTIHSTHEVLLELHDEQQAELLKYVQTKELKLDYGREFKISLNGEKGLSDADKSILYYALHLKAMVLTGDSTCRKVSKTHSIDVHGVLWVLERIVSKGFLTKEQACEALVKLRKLNTRLPNDDCDELMRKWK